MDDKCYSPSYKYQEHQVSIEDEDVFYLSDNEESDNNRNQPYMIRWKSGKRVDPRLLTTLESLKEIYGNTSDMFKNICQGMYNEFVHVFKKLGYMMEKNKEQSRTLERSLSIGSPRASISRGIGIEIDDDFVDEKFKVRPPTVIVGGSDGKGGQTVKRSSLMPEE